MSLLYLFSHTFHTNIMSIDIYVCQKFSIKHRSGITNEGMFICDLTFILR